MNNIEKLNQERRELELALPVKADLEMLQHYNDVVVLKGLKCMEEILDMPYEERIVEVGGENTMKVIEPKSKISAYAQIVATGRYLETRKANLKEEGVQIVFSSEDEDDE
jgi:hypothetical protein